MIDKNDPRLTSFVLGELNPASSAEIQRAIASSADLQIAVDEIRQAVELLGAAYLTEPPLRLLDEQKAELTKVQLDDGARELNRATNDRPWLPILLAASLLGFLVGGAMYLQHAPLSQELADRMERMEQTDNKQLAEIRDQVNENEESEKLSAGSAGLRGPSESMDFSIPVDATTFNETERRQGIEELATRFNLLIEEGKNDEARAVAEQVVENAPKSELAQRMSEQAMPFRRLERSGETREGKKERLGTPMSGAERTHPLDPEGSSDSASAFGIDEEVVGGEMERLNLNAAGGIAVTEQAAIELQMGELAIEGQTFELGRSGGLGGGGEGGGGFGGGGIGGGGGGIGADDGAGDFGKSLPGLDSSRGREQQYFDQSVQGQRSAMPAVDAPASQRPGRGGRGNQLDAIANQGLGDSITSVGGSRFDPPSQSVESPPNQDGQPGIARNAMTATTPRPSASAGERGTTADFDENPSGVRNQRMRMAGQAAPDARLAVEKEKKVEDLAGSVSRMARRGIEAKRLAGNSSEAEDNSTAKYMEDELARKEGREDDESDAFALPMKRKAVPRESRLSKLTSRGDSGIEEDSKGWNSNPKDLAELSSLGLQLGTRIQTQKQQRVVPVERTRPEVRSRQIVLDDGTKKIEKYTVEVPYVENVTEEFSIESPQVFVELPAERSERLVENLTRRINPDSNREIVLDEFFKKTRELSDLQSQSKSGEDGEADKDVLLALKLDDQVGKNASSLYGYDATPALDQINEALKKRNAKIRQLRSWKRVKATPNATRLMVGDNAELDLTGMQVNVKIDGFRARVLLDYFYYNDRAEPLEGNFKLRLPDDASLFYFAFGESSYDLNPQGDLATEEFIDDGSEFVALSAEKIRDARREVWKNVKESKMVPREKAAHAFRETVRRKIDPALVEWSGAGVFNARVFPLAKHKLHRIVIGYDVNLTKSAGQWVYELDLPEQPGQCQVDINVQAIKGVEYAIEPRSDPFENMVGGVEQRSYRFEGPQAETIRLTASEVPELLLYSADEFWGVQIQPDLPVDHVGGNPQAIFMLDTSLSSNPDKFNVWLKLLRSTLENNRDTLKRFNVLFFNVDAQFWQQEWVENTQENRRVVAEKVRHTDP